MQSIAAALCMTEILYSGHRLPRIGAGTAGAARAAPEKTAQHGGTGRLYSAQHATPRTCNTVLAPVHLHCMLLAASRIPAQG